MSLLSWWRRKVTVEEAHPDFPSVTRIVIDEGDGSKPQEVLLSRNNICSVAWVCGRFHESETEKGPIHDVHLTVTIPEGGFFADGTFQDKEIVYNLTIPDWAKYKFYRAVKERALALGWKGEVYHPNPTSWEHLLRDEGLG